MHVLCYADDATLMDLFDGTILCHPKLEWIAKVVPVHKGQRPSRRPQFALICWRSQTTKGELSWKQIEILCREFEPDHSNCVMYTKVDFELKYIFWSDFKAGKALESQIQFHDFINFATGIAQSDIFFTHFPVCGGTFVILERHQMKLSSTFCTFVQCLIEFVWALLDIRCCWISHLSWVRLGFAKHFTHFYQSSIPSITFPQHCADFYWSLRGISFCCTSQLSSIWLSLWTFGALNAMNRLGYFFQR